MPSRYPMARHEGGASGTPFSLLYRSRRLRSTLLGLPSGWRVRLELLFAFFAWCYRYLNATGQIPAPVLAPSVELEQTAALIDTGGSFRGREGVEAGMGGRSALAVDSTVGHIFRFEGGAVTQWEVYWEESDALEVAGIASAA